MARLGERLVPRLRGRGAWRGSPCPAGGHAAAARARTREDVTAARYGAIRVHNTIVQRFRATRVHSIPYVVIAVLQYDQARCKRRSASRRHRLVFGLVPRCGFVTVPDPAAAPALQFSTAPPVRPRGGAPRRDHVAVRPPRPASARSAAPPRRRPAARPVVRCVGVARRDAGGFVCYSSDEAFRVHSVS